jgi:endonuclease I
MYKRLFSIVLLMAFTITTYAQIPAGYYTTADGKTGASLKTALFNIISAHTTLTYTPGLWDAFKTTDVKPDGKVWDMYSNCVFTFVTNQDGGSGGSAECQYYNREHSFPKSWFGGEIPPMYTDLFHLYPTDKYVNNARGNLIFGNATTTSTTFNNGSIIGTSSESGSTLTVFEPIDEYKGDFARTYLYMATCYEDKIAGWASITAETSTILAGNTFPAFKSWYVQLLLSWCQLDPVSSKETARNNAVYSIQGNRNPYIDHPEYAQSVWGSGTGVAKEFINPVISVFPNPTKGEINVELIGAKSVRLSIVNLIGNRIIDIPYSGDKKPIDISKLTSGVYFVMILGDNFKSTTKIVVY